MKNYLARFFLVVLSWIACQQLHAQSVIQIEKRANQALAEKKFALAKVDFQTLVSREPESPTYNLNYAICLYNTDERNASKRYFEFALKYASTLCNAYFYLGKLNHLGYDFERAMVYYNQYLTCQKSDELNVKSEINFCVNGKELLKNPKKLKVLTSTNLPLASMLSKIDTESLGIGGGFFTDALLQTKQDKKKSYTPQLYFKRGNAFKVFSSYGEGQEFIGLYLQKRVTSDAWGKPTLIPIPQSGNWDLLYPYYHEASGYLYFSSNGFNSMGGKDFFRVKFNIETLECGSVENLGFPFSSSDDDLIFIPLNNDFSKSAFTSMRTTAPGKVSFFEAQFIPDLDPLVLIQGKLKDEVNQKNTQVTILVKDVNSGVEFGPFVSDQNGEYNLVLPGSGTYEFSATVNGSDQVFKNTQVIPSQAVNQVFTQDVNYSMKASQELAEFTYAFDQPINTDLLSLKHRALASMDQNLNSVKVQPNSTLTAKDNGSTKPSVPVEITEVFSQFGLTSDNLLENAKVLSDTLLAISDFGNVRSDQIELLQTLIQQNKAEQANLQSNNQSINLLLKEENDPIARKVLLDYQRELLDSLLNLENEVLVKNDFLDQLNSEKKDWEQQGLELKSNELSTKIAEALIKKDSVALLKLIADAKNDTERLLLITGNSKAEPNPLKELELMQSKLQSERSTLVKDFSSTQEQLQALKVDLQKAKKKDQEVIQGEINRLETRAKNLQLLIESKDEEILSHERTMQMAREKSLLEARLGLSMKENQKDIPYTESTIALNDQIRVNKNNQQSLAQLQASNKNSDPVRGLQAELKVLKLRMDAAPQEQKARMAEDFQNLEAKIENLKSDAVSINGGSSNNIAGQSSVTDNSTNLTQNSDNRGTNEVQENRSLENNSGQTNGTVNPDNRGTNEGQENRTAENNSGQTNGTVNPDNRGTNEVQENRTAENNSGQTNGTVNPDNRGTNEVQENRTAENNSGQTNGTVNPDNRGTNEGQVIRTAENNSGQTNGTVNPDNRGTNEGQEIRTAENRAEQTDGREKRNETVQKEEQLREVSQQVDQVLSVLEAETNTANSLEEQNNLDRIKSQLVQLNQTIELRQTMGESLYDKSFGVETLNRMIEETNQAIVSSGSGISSKVRPIQPLPSLDKSASSKTSDLLVFTKSTKPLTSQELATLSSQADYDQYLTLRKSISAQRRAKDSLALELQKTQILLYQNAKLDGVSSEFIERIRSIAEGMESLDQAIQRDFMELNTLSNNDQFANLVDQGISPAVNTNASSKKNYLQPIDVDFSLNANAKVQNNTYPILTQMPKGLVYRVQVGVFRNPVPDYFYREFTPVTGESLNNGLTAYLTGFFEGLNSARSVRDQIRGLGYKDAFIVAYCDGQRITNAQAAAYEKSGACSKRVKEDLLNEAFAILKETNQISQTPASKPKEVYFTVQVASLGSLDKGKLQGVPELMYTISPSGKYKYSSGKFDDLAIANARKKELRKQGYGDAYVVAYRDGIAVSYDEARIALSYMKETIAPTSPKNQDLAGVTYLPPPVKKYSLQKVESQIKRESIGKYNAMRSFVADSDKKVISCPVSFESISPFEWIYYADFAFDEVQNEYRVVVLSGNQSSSSVSIMHNVALHSNIPFEVKKKDNDGTELLFFTKNEEEIERLRNVANRLNLSLNVN